MRYVTTGVDSLVNGRCTRYQSTLPISGTVTTKIYKRTDT
eukprot:SAG11_NODE_30995_length_295_cov_2.882653_1_plen_39_part_10